jgi:excisionase family DNA binding protein
VMAATGIVRTMVYGAIKRGELLAVRVGPRALVIPAENLKAWLASMPPAVGGE